MQMTLFYCRRLWVGCRQYWTAAVQLVQSYYYNLTVQSPHVLIDPCVSDCISNMQLGPNFISWFHLLIIIIIIIIIISIIIIIIKTMFKVS